MHALVIIIGRHRGAATIRHLDGFATHARVLRDKLDIQSHLVEVPSLELVQHEVRAWMPDLVIVAPSFVDSAARVSAMCDRIRSNKPSPKVVYFDSYDLTSSPHFEVLPYVDRYLKSKMLRNIADYQKEYAGGNPLSDYVSRHFGADLAGWNFGSRVPNGQEHKIRPCWSFGASRDFDRMLRWAEKLRVPWRTRWFDLNRRIGLTTADANATHWYAQLRRHCASTLSTLRPNHRNTGVGRVSRRIYLPELTQSKIVFSPFGWGEVCFRDYEAVAAGCLLVKPDMSHIVTSPNIFVDGQTYVSVKWDLSDLEEKVDWWISHPKQASEVAGRAHALLRDYFVQRKFVDDVVNALDGLIPMRTNSVQSVVGGIA